MIVIDARMVNASGIGVYLKQLLPRIVAARPQRRFILLGDPGELSAFNWAGSDNVEIREFTAPVYSISEQVLAPLVVPRGSRLYWAPHFNVPLGVGTKLLTTVHDAFHLAMPQFVPGYHRRAYAAAMFRSLASRSQAILTVSHFTRRELLRLTPVHPEKIQVIYLGADPLWLRAEGANLKPHARPYLLYVGNVKPHKNLISLLTAFRSLVGSIPHDLVLVGKREGFLTADSFVAGAARALGDRILFTDFVTDEQLKAYFTHADALVHPSLYEGFGLSPLEAMACCTPAIVSNVASLPEVCGDAATYFDPRSPDDIARAILTLLKDPQLKAEMVKRGRQRANDFSWTNTAAATMEVLDRLVA
ncbi:MAG TPA: glycosyltransferase family 1 protein [Trueperaceae bacterium]